MGSILLVVGNILVEQSLQMALIQRDYVIEQVAATAFHPAFRDSVLPGALMEVCTQPISMDRIAAGTSNPYFAS